MKKSVWKWSMILAATILLLFSSCASNKPVVFNESLPDNEVAVIHFDGGGISIVEYNGITVNWKAPSSLFFRPIEIRIPGGSTQFILNGTIGSSSTGYYIWQNVPFTYNFENGKEYTLLVNYAVWIFNGKSTSMRNFITGFNMSNGQTEMKR